MSADTKRQLLKYQRNEITEYHIYHRLAQMQKLPENRRILERIAEDEKRHYEQWMHYTGEEAHVNWTKVRVFYWITRIFGLAFGTKLMERGEVGAQQSYADLPVDIDQVKAIAKEENEHENALLCMLDEERLRYMEMGGNKPAREVFEQHGLFKIDQNSRYRHPTAVRYRKQLAKMVHPQKHNMSDDGICYTRWHSI